MMIRRLLLSLLIVAQTYTMEKEIRYLKPPQLDEAHILKKMVCYRPRREVNGNQEPRIEREVRGDKTIIHDYGHTSGGWTMAWGAALETLQSLQPQDNINDIVIVGGGISGLAAAYLLTKVGQAPKEIIAYRFDDLTSHNAGGLFAHQSSHPDQTVRDRVNGWIIKSFPMYKRIASGEYPELAGGARAVPGYFANRETSDLEACVQAGVMKPAKDVIVDFQNGTRREMVVYDDNIFIDTAGMMQKLQRYLRDNGVRFKQEYVTQLHTINHAIIFNCAGLGAANLVPEDAELMIPVQGHLLLLKHQNRHDLEYTIEAEIGTGITSSGLPVSYYCYAFPKRMVGAAEDETEVVGGTSIKMVGDAKTIKNPHEEQFDVVLNNAQHYFGTTKN